MFCCLIHYVFNDGNIETCLRVIETERDGRRKRRGQVVCERDGKRSGRDGKKEKDKGREGGVAEDRGERGRFMMR